jgi:cytidine deaminase
MNLSDSERRVVETAERLATTLGNDPNHTVAAGDQGRGLIPPCGRCRQVLLDLHPDILVAVPTPTGPQLRPIRKLLPDAYFSPDATR